MMSHLTVAERLLEEFTFREFLHERSVIYEAIEEFLTMVLEYCVHMEDTLDFMFGPDDIGTQHLISLIQSLRTIHALYGYPTGESTLVFIEEDQLAFKHLVLNEIEVKNEAGSRISLGRYCRDIRNFRFWRKEVISESFSVESLLREPAYYFLEMVRNQGNGWVKPSVVAWKYLNTLPDGNCLKPAVWAEDAKNPDKYFATSLGVPHYIRPLYLYAKLGDLCKRKYSVVDACPNSHSMGEPRPHIYPDYTQLKTVVVNPCPSCRIFFESFKTKIERNITYFGLCAEFDVIQTMDSQQKLRAMKESNHWKSLKSACENQLSACSKLRNSVRISQRLKRNDLLEYFETTRNTNQKTLQYKWIPSKNSYELVTRDYTIEHEECGNSTPPKRQHPDGIDKQIVKYHSVHKGYVKETEPLNNYLWINKRERLKLMTLNAIQKAFQYNSTASLESEDESDDGFDTEDIRYPKKLLDEKVLETTKSKEYVDSMKSMTAAMQKKCPAFFTRQHPDAIDKQQDDSDDGFDTAGIRYPETLLGEKVLGTKSKEYVDTGNKKSEGCAKSTLRKRQHPDEQDESDGFDTADIRYPETLQRKKVQNTMKSKEYVDTMKALKAEMLKKCPEKFKQTNSAL